MPVQQGQLGHQALDPGPLDHHHRPAGEGVLEGVARVPQGQHSHRPALAGEGELLKLPSGAGVGELPPQNQGQAAVAEGGGDENVPHAQGPSRKPPAAPGEQQQPAPKGAGEHQKQPAGAQQPLRPAEGRQEHEHRRPGLAHRVLQKGPAGEKGQSPEPGPQGGGQGAAPPGHGRSVQLPGAGQQQVVHREVQRQEGVQIDHRHGLPPFPKGVPIIRSVPLQKRSEPGQDKKTGKRTCLGSRSVFRPSHAGMFMYPRCPVQRPGSAGGTTAGD